ncbi:hypothetical protein TELCIR_11921 [Teladorsagia circumcincta]|uniref:Phosphoserine phosphatase n=1 Tax=Teladorsagia circumcincta TaxID=45464 RepID=A0A2G9U9H3_TELCI|nr:hypothetical protein TELCIR_11921 [Teladorsagia circumcincta]
MAERGGNAGSLNMLRVAARPASSQLSAHAECHTHIETPEERARRIWRNADAVAFDVDSTVCQDEAIDELASFLGVGEAVANVTRQAMNGNARFRHALKARLEVMRPTYDQLEQYANETKPKAHTIRPTSRPHVQLCLECFGLVIMLKD